MDGMARAFGAGRVVQLGGTSYEIGALTLEDYATMEQHLLADRPSPVDNLKDVIAATTGANKESKEILLKLAYGDLKKGHKVPADDLQEWMSTPEGGVFATWLAMKQKKPDLTLDFVKKLFNEITPGEVKNLLEAQQQAAGIDEAGNSTGGSRRPPGKKKTKKKAQSTGVAG